MSESQPDPQSAPETSFDASPNLRSHKLLPHPGDTLNSSPPAEKVLNEASQHDDDSLSESSCSSNSLPSPPAVQGADSGLPPTPPSNSLDEAPETSFSPPPHADGVVSSLLSKKSSLSTPVNNRSPPTPDPSPPRTTESMRTPESSTRPERPPLFAYPSSRAESFKTAKEDFNSSEPGSRSSTPLGDRLSVVAEERGLGLAFERDDSDITPTNKVEDPFDMANNENDKAEPEGEEHKDPLNVEEIPNREWDTNLMRNVTIRKKRDPSRSPRKNLEPIDTDPPESPSARSSRRRSSSLRERVEASKTSPRTPSVENFARSIGWPADASNMPDDQPRDANSKRMSGSSVTSTVVEAMVIVTPPQRRRTLRHSGKNLAFRRDGESAENSPLNHSNRTSTNSDDVPLHKLVHKRANIVGRQRGSGDSDAHSYLSTPLSIRKRGTPIDASAYTLAHQESVRRVLQPAADILSRSNSLSRRYTPDKSYHKRISSAPEATTKISASPGPRTFLELSPPDSPTGETKRLNLPQIERTSPSVGRRTNEASPTSPKMLKRGLSVNSQYPPNYDKSLPDLPIQSTDEATPEEPQVPAVKVDNADQGPTTFYDSVSEQPAEESNQQESSLQKQVSSPTVRRGSLSSRGRSEERRRSTHSQDRRSTSGDTLLHPGMERGSDDHPRHSSEWHHDHRRVSFDRSTARTSEEHAMARHLFAQTTPFSQFSDTPIEVSEATAVSIFPHNNHSLLVVQQPARASLMPGDYGEVPYDRTVPTADPQASDEASALLLTNNEEGAARSEQPRVTVEPSTPPMKISLPAQVDSPLKNPRAAPEPPKINFIPPTPLDEIEGLQLQPAPPGPPKRSDSHPQRRLSLKERARRYSDNFITPLLSRASSTRGRYVSDSHAHQKPRVPTVNDEDGSLHPFWRPRGFWDDFTDSESESEDDDDRLPRGGDTSDVEPDPEPEPSPKKAAVLKRRLTNGFKGPGGFLIGNSLGVERSGTNRRRPHIQLPARRTSKSPKILIQAPTLPIRTRSRSPQADRVEKRSSRSSLRSTGGSSLERPRRTSRRDAWRNGKRIPGVPRLQVQYIGLSGVKERIRERRAEKRREEIRRSIGTRYYVEGGTNVG